MEEVRNAYDKEASEYDKKWGFYIEATIGETWERVQRFIILDGHEQTVLDVGCGTGALFHRMKLDSVGEEVSMVGVDISSGMFIFL